MARHSKTNPQSKATQEEAMRIARGTQRPGQTKEQTRLIEQGIQKGILQYRKQQNAKARERDKKLKKAKKVTTASQPLPPPETLEKVVYRQHWLPWILLVFSWLVMAVYWLAS